MLSARLYLVFLTLSIFYIAAATSSSWSQVSDLSVDDRLKINVRQSSSRIEGRITNGTLASPKQFPYQVGLTLYVEGGRAWCGGSIISNRWILTAAHCPVDAFGVDVYVGAHNRTNNKEAGQQIIYVGKRGIFVHEKYDSQAISNDIALLKLPVVLDFNEYVRPVKLPKVAAGETAPTYAGERAIASGWGRISDAAATVTDVLQFIEVPIIENSVCNRYYLGSVLDSNICISTSAEKKSTCNGDSGGPLVLVDGANNDILIGATSFGIIFGCEIGFPGAFTRITSYLDWIEKISGVV